MRAAAVGVGSKGTRVQGTPPPQAPPTRRCCPLDGGGPCTGPRLCCTAARAGPRASVASELPGRRRAEPRPCEYQRRASAEMSHGVLGLDGERGIAGREQRLRRGAELCEHRGSAVVRVGVGQVAGRYVVEAVQNPHRRGPGPVQCRASVVMCQRAPEGSWEIAHSTVEISPKTSATAGSASQRSAVRNRRRCKRGTAPQLRVVARNAHPTSVYEIRAHTRGQYRAAKI